MARVLEKSPEYVMAAIIDCLKKLKIKHGEYKHFINWSDGPTTYKNGTTMATFAYTILEEYKLVQANLEYGCPKHFKSDLDGDFGHVQHILHLAKQHKDLYELEDAVDAVRAAFDEENKRHPNRVQRYVHCYWPDDKNSYNFRSFDPASLKGVKGSYSFSFRRIHLTPNRKSLHGAGFNYFTLTNLMMRNHVLTGFPVGPGKSGHPVILPRKIYTSAEGAAAAPAPPPGALPDEGPPVAVAPDDVRADAVVPEEAAEDDDLGEEPAAPIDPHMLRQTKEWNKWRISYTLCKPQDKRRDMRRQHLIKISKGLPKAKVEPCRFKTNHEKAAAEATRQGKKAAAAKERTAYYAK